MKRRGLTLLEVLLALLICAVLMVGLLQGLPAMLGQGPAAQDTALMIAEVEPLLYAFPYENRSGMLKKDWIWQRSVRAMEQGWWLRLEIRHGQRRWCFESWVTDP